jgi:hypothetical protein
MDSVHFLLTVSVESVWTPCGLHTDLWTPCGLRMDSVRICGVHTESTRTGGGL